MGKYTFEMFLVNPALFIPYDICNGLGHICIQYFQQIKIRMENLRLPMCLCEKSLQGQPKSRDLYSD